MKRILSIFLAAALTFGLLPVPVLAAETDGLCAHHPAHTAECGYAEGSAGSACTHTHNDACGYKAAVAEGKCACTETDENGALVHTEGCGYTAPVAGADCTHAHDGSCGYVAAVPTHACQYFCVECSAALTADEVTEPSAEATDPSTETTEPSTEATEPSTETTEPSTEATEPSTEATEPAPVCTCGVTEGETHTEDCDLYVAPAEPVCTCETDDPAIHATNCAVYVAPENPECFCVEKCGVENQNFWCDICGFDVTACQGGDDQGWGAFDTTYPLMVGTTEVTNENKNQLLGTNAEISYDEATNTVTLTLSGATIPKDIMASANLHIILANGTQNTVNGVITTYYIHSSSDTLYSNDLTISGTGSLSVEEAIMGESITLNGPQIQNPGYRKGSYVVGDYNVEAILDSNGNPAEGINLGPVYTVTYAANGGSGTMNTVNVAAGGEFTLPKCTFLPPQDKHFAGWLVNSEAELKQPDATITVTGNTTLTAQWADGAATYDITISSEILNGTVTADPTSAEADATVTLTVTPSTDYYLDTLTVQDANGQNVATTRQADGTYTFTMSAGGATVSATFAAVTLWVGGIPVTKDNANNITGETITGSVRYDGDYLNLDGATITGGIRSNGQLDIYLTGNNVVKNDNGDGITTTTGSINIREEGEGFLTVTASGTGIVSAHYVNINSGDVTVSGSTGISCVQLCIYSGNTQVTGSSGTAIASGVWLGSSVNTDFPHVILTGSIGGTITAGAAGNYRTSAAGDWTEVAQGSTISHESLTYLEYQGGGTVATVTVGSETSNYITLQDALDAAAENPGSTVTLLATTGSTLSFSANGTFTIDLNGFQIGGWLTVTGGDVTLTDSQTNARVFQLQANGGTVTLDGVNVTFLYLNGGAVNVTIKQLDMTLVAIRAASTLGKFATGTFDSISEEQVGECGNVFACSNRESGAEFQTPTVRAEYREDEKAWYLVDDVGSHVQISEAGFTYNGQSQTPTLTTSLTAGTDYTVSYTKSDNPDPLDGAPTDADTYIMTVTGTGNYFGTVTKEFTIAPKAVTVNVAGTQEAKVYTSQEQTVTGYTLSCDDPLYNTATTPKVTVTGSAEAKGTNVGEYSMGLTADNFTNTDGNFTVTFNVTDGKLTITKADPTCTPPSGLEATYGALLSSITLTNPSGNTPGTWAWANPSNTVGNAGTNTFSATFTPRDTANYNSKTAAVTVRVDKAPLTASGNVTATGTYGQTLSQLTLSGPSATSNGTEVPGAWTLTGNTIPNVGDTGDLTATFIPTAGADNYELLTMPVTLNITAKALTDPNVTGVEASYTYTGSAIRPVITVKDGYTTLTNGRDYDVSYGNNTTVVEGGTVTITFKGNYSGANVVKSFTIEKATLTITADNKTAIAGDTKPTLTYTVTGLIAPDKLDPAPTLSCTADMTTAGTYAITVTGGDAGDNYTIQRVNGTLTVKAKHTITSSSGSNGTITLNPTNAAEGTEVTITVTPKSGYKLSTLTVKDANGKSYAVSTDNNGKYYFTMPSADVTVKATFSKISTSTADPTNPKTGDDFHILFWSGMMMTTLLGAAALLLNKKKFYER